MTADMTSVIQPKSDQINADDLISGPMTVTIEGVKIVPGTEQPVSMTIKGTPKVYRPCKSMARVMVTAWGADANQYVGRSLTLYRDPKVKWGGLEVGGIRISHMSHLERELMVMLTMSKANRAPAKIKPLVANNDAPSITPEDAMASASAEARKGKSAFTAWWNSDFGKGCRDLVKPNMAELNRLATEADAANQQVDEEEPPM